MPLDAEYDKMINSKFADMKNTGGAAGAARSPRRSSSSASSTTRRRGRISTSPAPASIRRQTDINKSWGSGWGVRLLDRLVADYYEK